MGSWKRGYYYSKGQYVGKGETALAIAERDALDLAEAGRDRARRRRRRREDGRSFRAARQSAELVDRAFSLALAAAGFHRHARGQWRRSRMNRTDLTAARPSPEILAELRGLVRSTDPAAIAELKRIGDDHPAELIEATRADLAALVESTYLASVAPQRALRLGVAAKLHELRAELCAGSTNPVLRLAAEAAAHRWLDHWILETQAAGAPGTASPVQESRRTWAHRRYLQSLAYVARIARLTRPRVPKVAVQIINRPAADPDRRPYPALES